MRRPESKPLLICFSHLRWDFVFQRPQQLMTRLAKHFRIIFWEEPVFDSARPRVELADRENGAIRIATPHLAPGSQGDRLLSRLLDDLIASEGPASVLWYYTPMMLPISRHVARQCIVYDCMDELANFRFAPENLLQLEQELIEAADLVFTGGISLYEAKRERHPRVHAFPSSVDCSHFRQARNQDGPARTRPRLGFYGVIDERMDLGLLAHLAGERPDWDIELIGPVAKLEASDLPSLPNLLYSGARSYDELPGALAGWDVALMPFAINDATRFISPTKTPEYLAGGKPVVSTQIRDVVRGYGDVEGVFIAETAAQFIAYCDAALALAAGGRDWLKQADALLASSSWDRTADAMQGLIRALLPRKGRGPTKSQTYDWVVVGAGFAGSVMAQQLAADGGQRVLLLDRRPHIGGNAFDCRDKAGILMHRYGPHIFHTNSADVFAYLSQFTDWRPYEHRVLADLEGRQVPIPINRTTLNALYDAQLDCEDSTARFLTRRAEPVAQVKSSEDILISTIGRELYELFFRGYTRKQWGLDPSQLDKAVAARVPARTSTDDRYFTDRFQAMPKDGFTAMFRKMLAHPLIDVRLGVDFAAVRDRISYKRLVYTGPVDEYFHFKFGRLPYRSLSFHHCTKPVAQFQKVAVVNYPQEDVPYTRVTEYKHLTGQQSPATSITYEYPSAVGDPYYPIPSEASQALYKKYEALALKEPNVTFVGRLATYRYYNMDQVVGQALATYRRLKPSLRAVHTMGLPAGTAPPAE